MSDTNETKKVGFFEGEGGYSMTRLIAFILCLIGCVAIFFNVWYEETDWRVVLVRGGLTVGLPFLFMFLSLKVRDMTAETLGDIVKGIVKKE